MFLGLAEEMKLDELAIVKNYFPFFRQKIVFVQTLAMMEIPKGYGGWVLFIYFMSCSKPFFDDLPLNT